MSVADGNTNQNDDGKGNTTGTGDKPTSMLDVDAIKNGAVDQNDPAAAQKAADDAAAAAAAKAAGGDDKPKDGDKPVRPDWLKEDKFWDAEKGEVKTQDILKSYQELEKKFRAGDHKAPEKATDYKLALTDEQKTILFGDTAANPGDDEGIKALTEWGVKHKISQDSLNELLGEYVKFVEPELAKHTIDIEAEKAALGKNADAIIKNQMDFLGHLYRSGHINDKHLDEARILMETSAGVQVLQKIREYYGEQPIPTTSSAEAGMPTREELSAMLNDPKYDTDPEFKAKVDALYAKRYGNGPAMSSAQNR